MMKWGGWNTPHVPALYIDGSDETKRRHNRRLDIVPVPDMSVRQQQLALPSVAAPAMIAGPALSSSAVAIAAPSAPAMAIAAPPAPTMEIAAPLAPAMEIAAPSAPAAEIAAPSALAMEIAAPPAPAMEIAAPPAPAVEIAAPLASDMAASVIGQDSITGASAESTVAQLRSMQFDMMKEILKKEKKRLQRRFERKLDLIRIQQNLERQRVCFIFRSCSS